MNIFQAREHLKAVEGCTEPLVYLLTNSMLYSFIGFVWIRSAKYNEIVGKVLGK